MKTLKRFGSFLLAMALALGMLAGTALAQEVDTGKGGQGSIEITNATAGQTYKVYKIFDATVSGEKIAYAATESVKNWLSADTTASNLFTFTKNTAGTYNVTWSDNDKIKSFFQSLITKGEGETVNTVNSNLSALLAGTASSVTESTVKFTGLQYGYYLVESSLGATVTLTSTKPTATVVDKNQSGPTWDNEPDEPGDGDDKNPGKIITAVDGKATLLSSDKQSASANYGSTVSFDIGINATNYDGENKITEYYVMDSLDNGLAYDKNSITVKVKAGATTAQTLTLNTDYYIQYSEDDHDFKISIPWVDADRNQKYTSPSEIHVTYSATVNATGENVVIAGEGNKNSATFAYAKNTTPPTTPPDDPDPYDPSNPDLPEGSQKSETKTTTTYVYALGFTKVDGNTGTKLSGAEFTCSSLKLKATDTNGVYVLDNTSGSDTLTLSTNENGVLIIKGVSAGTYSITETKAPDGYNLLTAPISVTASLTDTETYTMTTTTYYDAEGNVQSTEQTDGTTVTTSYAVNVVDTIVKNYSGSQLPTTGGIGTTIFYVVGGMLVLGAGVLLVTRKRLEK